MSAGSRAKTTWREFEKLVARIEADAGPLGLTVVSLDRIRCKITGRLREVDASVRMKLGTTGILVTIECRRRTGKQDVTWIEQLAAKKQSLGAARTIAVSSTGFSAEAVNAAHYHGIDLRQLSDVSAEDINQLMRIDFVVFTHKVCAPVRVALRTYHSAAWTMPDPNDTTLLLPEVTDLFAPIFQNTESSVAWSINDLWLELQAATEPFAGLTVGSPPIVRTVCFSYPGNVTVQTPNGTVQLGDVLLSIRLWLEPEQVNLESAHRVEYKTPGGEALQRIEFVSAKPGLEDWRVSLQMPKDSADLSELRTGGDWPTRERAEE
jgi:hypothetical protein